MAENVLLLVIPIVVAFWPLWLLRRWKFFSDLSLAEKGIVSLVFGTVLLTFLLVYFGLIFSSGFKLFSRIILEVLLIFVAIGILEKKNEVGVLWKQIKKAGVSIPPIFLALFAAYFAKVLLFLRFKPIIDPDVINQYFPFARSIFLADSIPMRNFYDAQAMMVPPIGGPTLYAWVYSLAGSIESEAFRLIMLPFLVGSALLTYLIARRFFQSKLAFLATAVFLFLTIQDELLFEFVYYADTIFVFLALSFFYFLIKFFEKREGHRLAPKAILLGVILGTALLFKFQAIFLFYFFGAYLWLKAVPAKNWSPILVMAILLPFLLTFYPIAGFTTAGFNRPSFFASTFLLVLLFLSGWLVSLAQGKIELSKNVKIAFVTALFVLPGSIWLARNILLFGNPFVEQSSSVIWAASIGNEIGILPGGMHPFALFSILLLPTAGSLWLLPKLAGLWIWLQDKRYALLGFWLVAWFCFWIFYLGAVDIRYLLAAMPALAIFIVLGIEKLFTKEKQAVLIFILILVFLSLTQSLFLWWNFGYLVYGSAATIRQQAMEMLNGAGVGRGLFDQATDWVRSIVVVLNARGEFYTMHAPKLALLGVFFGGVIFFLSRSFSRRLKISLEDSKPIAVFVFLVLFFPYLFVFLTISDGSLKNFAVQEQKKIYTYKGQANYIVPYLKENIKEDSAIAVYGTPSGLAYFINRPVWHLEYGRELAQFEEIFAEKDLEKIYQFYKKNNIDFFVIDTQGLSWQHFNQLKERTKMFDILDNPKYFTLVVEPGPDNVWALYQINVI